MTTTNVRERGRIARFLMSWEAVITLFFVAMMTVNSFLSPFFLDGFNLLNATFNFMEKAIIALPMMFVIIAGDIDISVAGIIALSSLFMGLVAGLGAGTPAIVGIGLLTGLLAGMVNGALVTRLRIPAIAVTIGSVSLFRGIAHAVLGDQAITAYPPGFEFLGQGAVWGIPVPLLIFAVLAAGAGFILHKTRFGRMTYAIGNNPVAARYSGVPVDRIRFILFSACGLFSSLAAVLLTSRILSTRPSIALGYELETITTVVLGGVAITGGRGKLYGVIVAVFLLGFLNYGMGLLNVPGKVMNVFTGLLLILAIVVPGFTEGFRKARR